MMMKMKMMIMVVIVTPGDRCAPRDAGDWSALNYCSLEQPSSSGVQLRFVNDKKVLTFFAGVFCATRWCGGGERLKLVLSHHLL